MFLLVKQELSWLLCAWENTPFKSLDIFDFQHYIWNREFKITSVILTCFSTRGIEQAKQTAYREDYVYFLR